MVIDIVSYNQTKIIINNQEKILIGVGYTRRFLKKCEKINGNRCNMYIGTKLSKKD